MRIFLLYIRRRVVSDLFFIHNKIILFFDSGAPCPEITDLPAIAAIYQDGTLYRALLGLLRTKPPSMVGGADFPLPGSTQEPTPRVESRDCSLSVSNNDLPSIGRKRSASMSLSDVRTPKQAKLTLSPLSTARKKKMQVNAPPFASPQQMLPSSDQFVAITENFNVPVFASTVLFTAFSHLDHWPVELARAYGEDSFGARSWVDDERCSLLVQNLSLIHSEGGVHAIAVDGQTGDGNLWSQYYSHLLQQNPNYDDASSSDSGSEGGEECILEVSAGTSVVSKSGSTSKAKIEELNDGCTSSSSESGEEEILVNESGNADAPDGNKSSSDIPAALAIAALTHYRKATSAPPLNDDDDSIDASSHSHAPFLEATALPFEDKSSLTASDSVTPPSSNFPRTVVAVPLPWKTTTINPTMIRPRYTESCRIAAHKAIGESLSQRLGAKVKQNSGLLAMLPNFISVPQIRALTARHLERWLKSPALSGLARPLFVAIVQAIENVDPPLEEDIATIDSILAMKLKANQLSTHIDNVKSIVRRVPSLSVARHIFYQLLSHMMESDQSPHKSSSHAAFFFSVFETHPDELASNAFALALVDLMRHGTGGGEHHELFSIINLVRQISTTLGLSYQGHMLVKSLLYPEDDNARPKSLTEANSFSRLAFECIALMAHQHLGHAAGSDSVPPSKIKRQTAVPGPGTAQNQRHEPKMDQVRSFAWKLSSARKVALRWCLSTYASLVGASKGVRNEQHWQNNELNDHSRFGASSPDYQSVLDGESPSDYCGDIKNPKISVVRMCRAILFLAHPKTEEMKSFLSQGGMVESVLDENERSRIMFCYENSLVVDEEVLRIILEASRSDAGINNVTALLLIEQLFFSCRHGCNASISIKNSDIVWDLYHLAEYRPHNAAKDGYHSSQSECSGAGESPPKLMRSRHSLDSQGGYSSNQIPKLAYPGLWWRVTSIVLVICGTNRSTIGAQLWDKSATIRDLIKMITSGRYRFPTVDSDAEASELTKKGEADMREKESKITEQLFFPQSTSDIGPENTIQASQNIKGARVSARQRAMRERLEAIKLEKEAAAALLKAQRRKKLIRTAQKSIMIWDPQGPARKPPKGAVLLVLSVQALFRLSEGLRSCRDPDYLLRAIGSTSRASIERAYDWLIPVVSCQPQIINRLPSSASCFLLLRAYGAEGNRNAQLLQLSGPLQKHVRSCLSGALSKNDALKAADLLFHDMSDENPERRRCARRVLRKAINEEKDSGDLLFTDTDDVSWLLHLREGRFAQEIVSVATTHLIHAVAHERGGVLRSLLLALNSYLRFIAEKQVDTPGGRSFCGIFCELLSIRSRVCCDAMDRFVELRDLALSVVSKSLESYAKGTSSVATESTTGVTLIIGEGKPVKVPYELLRASLVLIANWNESNTLQLNRSSDMFDLCKPKDACSYLARTLVVPQAAQGSSNQPLGATGAKFVEGNMRAVSVEQWKLLAKSRCEEISELSGVSAPDIFLPRLLLCSGISKASLFRMLCRLDNVGRMSPDSGRYFGQLLSRSATSQWGGEFSGSRRVLARKLLGRISAYVHLKSPTDKSTNTDCAQTSLFVSWLKECSEHKQYKPKKKKNKLSASGTVKRPLPDYLKSYPTKGSLCNVIIESVRNPDSAFTPPSQEQESSLQFICNAYNNENQKSCQGDTALREEVINDFLSRSDFEGLERVIQKTDFDSRERTESAVSSPNQVARIILSRLSYENSSRCFVNFALKWVPYLTQCDSCNRSIWENIFRRSDHSIHGVNSLLASRCGQQWSKFQIDDCQRWILTTVHENTVSGEYSPEIMVKFLVLASGQPTMQRLPFAGSSHPNYNLVESQVNASAMVRLALAAADTDKRSGLELADSNGNMLPDWILLLDMVSRCSKNHLALVTKSLVSELPSEGWKGSVYPLILLRLYTYLPQNMNLADSKLRSILVDAAARKSSRWLEWICPLDNQVRQMVASLEINPSQRLLQALIDMSKRQPLVFLRHLGRTGGILMEDGAAGRTVALAADMGRGRITAGSADGSAKAKTRRGKKLRVTVVHWGYGFTEPLWSSVLEILASLPGEVAFASGLQMGIVDVWAAFLRLFWVQNSLNCNENTSRLRSKLATMFAGFNSFDKLKWAAFMESRLSGLENCGPVRAIVEACEVSV